jgi:hypothetical protein
MKLLPPFAELGEAVLPPAPPEGPTAETSLDLLRAIYRDPMQSLTVRMRAAIAALGYEHPKLLVSASVNHRGMGDAIERAHRERFAPKRR